MFNLRWSFKVTRVIIWDLPPNKKHVSNHSLVCPSGARDLPLERIASCGSSSKHNRRNLSRNFHALLDKLGKRIGVEVASHTVTLRAKWPKIQPEKNHTPWLLCLRGPNAFWGIFPGISWEVATMLRTRKCTLELFICSGQTIVTHNRTT